MTEPFVNGNKLQLMTELYEFSLADGYFSGGMEDIVACFDLFFRRVPDNGGFAIMAGLEQVIEYLKNLHFDEDDLAFCVKRAFPSLSLTIFATSVLPVTFGQFPKARPFSQMSRL